MDILKRIRTDASISFEKRREDGTDNSSRAVERLLRHGRKYHLHGWISTQRIAHLNTNAQF